MEDGDALQHLLGRTAAGDHAAFAEVYRRTRAHLFGLALRMLGSEPAAEDVLQEAFISIWKNASGYRTHVGGAEIRPMTWLIAIVRNKALDALRSRARRKEDPVATRDDGEDDEPADANSPSALELLARSTATLRIQGCMESLDASHRQSLALAYYQGLSHSEVAGHMRAPLGSVKAWIRRGLERLKSCLAAQGIAA
jgi:RNA polymerase sigma-70 factor (ECF subfamily)